MILWQFGFKVESQNSEEFALGHLVLEFYIIFVRVVHVLMVAGVLWLGGGGVPFFCVCCLCTES